MSVPEKQYNILFGFKNIDEAQIKEVRLTLESKGVNIKDLSLKYSKRGVLNHIEEFPDTDVLIVSEYLDSISPFTAREFSVFSDKKSNLLVIPIIVQEHKGTSYLGQLYNAQILNALFDDDASFDEIARLILKPRQRRVARTYYNLEEVLDEVVNVDLLQSKKEIEQESTPEGKIEKAHYVKSLLDEKDFIRVVASLNDSTKKILSMDSELGKCLLKGSITREVKQARNPIINPFSIPIPVPTFKKSDRHGASDGPVREVKIIEEKIVYQTETVHVVNKAFIGFCGAKEGIGTTHQTIVSASYLESKGYRVAVVESDKVTQPTFKKIQDAWEIDSSSDLSFRLNNIDFFPYFDIDDIYKILLRNYNFILIDFGKYSEKKLPEFRRCVLQVIVTGSKPWDNNLNLIFKTNDKEALKEYTYLFNSTSDEYKKDVLKNMEDLQKIVFSSYMPNPFKLDISKKELLYLDMLFSEYVGSGLKIKRNSLTERIKEGLNHVFKKEKEESKET